MTDRDRPDLPALLDEMAAATDRVLQSVDRMSEPDVRGPSLLPGWTRAHVLTHLARNADGLVNLLEAARTGDGRPMYAGWRAGRIADIEAGAGRHLGDLRLDVAESADRLMAAFAGGLTAEAQEREVVLGSGATAYGWEIPLLRTREVEIHHVDLAAGYTTADWPEPFVARTLDQLAGQFRARGDLPVGRLVSADGGEWETGGAGPTLSGPAHALLGWLTGRRAEPAAGGTDLTLDSGGPVPPAPTWS